METNKINVCILGKGNCTKCGKLIKVNLLSVLKPYCSEQCKKEDKDFFDSLSEAVY
jgi:hypothetical protein